MDSQSLPRKGKIGPDAKRDDASGTEWSSVGSPGAQRPGNTGSRLEDLEIAMNKHSKATALVPAYQAGEFIQATLDSLSAQTHGNFDAIVSVDLCADETHAICMDHSARDGRFRVVRQDRRLGYVGNCNYLLAQADADYVLFAFHDDILAPRYVEALCGVLDARPEVVMCYSDILLTTVDGRTSQSSFSIMEGVNDRGRRGLMMLSRPDNWWVPNRGVFRLRDSRRIGGLKSHGAGEFSADWPWLFHMSLLGEFARVPEILCHKFYKPGSLCKTWAFSAEQHYEVSAACMRELWDSDLSTDEKIGLAQPLINGMVKVRGRIGRAADATAETGFQQRSSSSGSTTPHGQTWPPGGLPSSRWRFF